MVEIKAATKELINEFKSQYDKLSIFAKSISSGKLKMKLPNNPIFYCWFQGIDNLLSKPLNERKKINVNAIKLFLFMVFLVLYEIN